MNDAIRSPEQDPAERARMDERADKNARINAVVTGGRHDFVDSHCRHCGVSSWDLADCSDKECTLLYFEDLNAIALAESLLTPHQCHEYNKELVRALGATRPLTTSETWTWGAGAAVKAECLGKVLKLW